MRHLSLLLTVALVAAVRADAQQTTPQYLNVSVNASTEDAVGSGSRSNSARSSAPLPGLTSPNRTLPRSAFTSFLSTWPKRTAAEQESRKGCRVPSPSQSRCSPVR